MKVYLAFCDECGWSSRLDSEPRAAYAYSRHSCRKKRRADLAAARRRNREAAVDRTPKPCAHKVAKHQHGTYACYVLDACRCTPCAKANSHYEANRTRMNAYGRSAMVDAGPVRAHVRDLMAAGVGLKRITALTGISSGVLCKLMYGVAASTGNPTRPPAKRVRKATAARILAVRADQQADGAKVDPTGTVRRLQGLGALGWSVSRIATAHDLDRQVLDRALRGGAVLKRTADRVREIADAIGDRPAPARDHGERYSVSRTRRRALAAGWVPPAAWDQETIDDPAALPATFEALPECTYNARIDIDEWVFLVGGGADIEDAARRCGASSARAVVDAATRHHHEGALRLWREIDRRAAA